MAGALVTPVESLRVDGIQPTDAAAEVAFGSLDQQPILILQQTITMAKPPVLPDLPPEKFEKPTAVAILEKYCLAGIAASAHVINGAREFNPQRSRHEREH
jgi:hypothetical protein